MELLEEILSRDNMNKAYKKVYQNKGTAGIDGITVEEISDYIKENGEYMESTGFFASLGNVGYYGQSNQLTIWSEQCRIIKELAEKGDCVIVGRCADYVLKDADVNMLKTFIYADMDYRAKRIVEQYGESNINPEKRLKDKDKKRAAYYEIYTDQKFGNPLNYDLCLKSSSLSVERCADIIAEEYNRK